ncbi:MAG: phenylalanine--tRNA ligase subunit beta, partial [Bacteroidales bacterium]|nr:phenylalanine--tRNA ligase subunit beta [Bacteroidales bacterium]
MKISYNWLKKYLDFNLSVSETSEILTDIGLEVESAELYEPIKGGLEGVLVGKVMKCVKHPDADKLQVTKVDIGTSEPLQIVCGAPNVAEGQTVLVATIGTKLFFSDGNELLIKKAKIRGIPSEGMICAEDELGIGESHEGILVLSDAFEVGKKASEMFFTENDTVFEIGLTPNRSDAISHYGVARDLAAALSMRKKVIFTAKLPDVSSFKPEIKKNPISIVINDAENCSRYAGVFFKN